MSAGATPSGPPVAIGDLLAESAWIRALARSLVRDTHAADDIVQETWVAVLRRPPRAGQPLRPWLGQVVRNFARMRRRGEANRRRREESAARRESVPGTTEMVERVEVHRTLADSVLALEEPFRSTVLLRYFEGLKAAEIARRTGTPAGTVRWRLKRGLDQLRGRLDRERGGRGAWLGAVAALAETPEVSIGLGTLGLPFPLAAALWIGVLALAVALFGPGLLERVGRGPRAIGAPEGVGLETSSAPAPADELAEGDARRPAPAGEPAGGAATGVPRARVLARAVDSSGSPLEGIRLSAGGAAAVSDASGEVTLELAAGAPRSLELVASGEGFVPHRERARVDPGGSTDLGDVVLAPAGVVSGRVVGADGRALRSAEISVEGLGGRWLGHRHLPLEEARYLGSLLERTGGEVASGSTDQQGRFSIGGLPGGFVRVWAGAAGHFHAYSDPVPVVPGLESAAGELVLHRPSPGERIEGRVVDPFGAPVAGARIEAARRSLEALFFRDEPFVFRAEAGADGRFVLALDPSSRYSLAAADPGARWRPVVDSPRAAGERDVLLRLGTWETLELDVSGPEEGDVQLTLIDARRRRRLDPETASAKLSGTRAPWVPFVVRIAAPGFSPGELGPFEPGRVPALATIALARLDGPLGHVVWDGAPVVGALVTLRRALAPEVARVFPGRTRGGPPLFALCEPGKALHRTTTDTAGRFVLPRGSPGRYLLRVEVDGLARAVLGPLELFGDGRAALDIELEPGGALAGRVLAPEGTSPAGRVVGVSSGDGFLRSQRVGADGRYRFEDLPPGSWQVRPLRRETTVLGWGRLASTSVEVHASEVGWDCAVRGGGTTRFDLRLPAPVTCRLEGRLTIDGASPGPWHGRLVPLAGDAERRSLTALDHEGRFVLETEEPGPHALELWNSGYRPVFVLLADEVVLSEGSSSWTLDLQGATLSGTGGEPEQEDLEHVWNGGGALSVTTRLECDVDGRFGPVRVPAGVGHVQGEGKELAALDLAPGEERDLTLER